MAREPLPTFFFALVVVRMGDRFLLVHERKHRQTWFLPAGRVEPGETLVAAALRETLEETGVRVVLDGVLRVEHNPADLMTRVRVFFCGHAGAGAVPKREPDEHSLEARWVTTAEMRELPLRGNEVLEICEAVLAGAPVYPLSLLVDEGADWG